MTYQETLYALYKETEKTTIFAMNSFGDAEIGIGFRRACCYSDLKDPVVDGVYFMLCADAWNNKKERKISTTYEFALTDKEDISIRLRAISCFPSCEVNLGLYRITNFVLSEEGFGGIMMRNPYGEKSKIGYSMKYPNYIRLDIERIS